ncbi:uncharacterized protein LOC115033562 [Acyrthosiphon pisum]|uniref:Reverse transcriptase domain-containing protein n=1 Tax=Acyrthosiphon pisum TaxID=7029 RepID=A0A8R2NKV9_ACYPI|nr:uncharacterized protein LOC115033562 [Acyrthosiphon pisum]
MRIGNRAFPRDFRIGFFESGFECRAALVIGGVVLGAQGAFGRTAAVFGAVLRLRQGDALSPTLFNIALESVVREVLDDVTGLRIGGGHQITLAAYADDIIIMGETEEDLKRSAEKLINVNQQANSHNEIKRRITAGNKSYFVLVPIFKSRLISKNTKIRLYKVLIRPIDCMLVEHGHQQSRTRKDYYYLKGKYCGESMDPKETRTIYMNEELMQN